MGAVPATLGPVLAGARSFSASAPERARTAAIWAARVAAVERAAPSAVVADDGDTVRLGELSPGCIACKAGEWDCIFVTMRCNLSCGFCLGPHVAADVPPHSALGDDPAVLAERYARADVTGASFSGGEPFLTPETMVAWTTGLRAAVPGLYLWAYTNGVLLTTTLLERLADAGLDELRFNVAATGYADEHVELMLAQAAERLPAVTVEVPAIPSDREAILGSLGRWAERGVRYLNLHELVYEAGTNSGTLPGERAPVVMPDGHRCEADPGSEALALEVIERVVAEGLPLGVNDCSLRNKARQLRGRRRMLAPFTLEPHERLRDDGSAECAVLYPASDGPAAIAPDTPAEFVSLSEWEGRLAVKPPGWRAARAVRLLPLDLERTSEWVDFEPLEREVAAR
jgi:pyruvate formate-lyase activating enzyme-like uncharacterized protein